MNTPNATIRNSSNPHVESPELDTVARYGMPPYIQYWYRLTNEALSRNPPLASLLTLSINDGGGQNWLKTFAGLTIGALTESLIACSYHAKNICNLEAELVTTADKLYPGTLPWSVLIGCGNDCKIAFEYQAYVAAYRRSLDYLGRAVGAYFQFEIGAIKDFQSSAIQQKIRESARGQAMPDVANEVLGYMTFLLENDVNIFALEQQRLGRDRLTPWENVFAGTLTVMATPEEMQIGLISGNEELKPLYQDYRDFTAAEELFHLGTKLMTRSGILAHRVADTYAHLKIIRSHPQSMELSAPKSSANFSNRLISPTK